VEDKGVVDERLGDMVEGAGDEEGCVASRYYLRSAMRSVSGKGAGTGATIALEELFEEEGKGHAVILLVRGGVKVVERRVVSGVKQSGFE
jgi:hypothetical protein